MTASGDPIEDWNMSALTLDPLMAKTARLGRKPGRRWLNTSWVLHREMSLACRDSAKRNRFSAPNNMFFCWCSNPDQAELGKQTNKQNNNRFPGSKATSGQVPWPQRREAREVDHLSQGKKALLGDVRTCSQQVRFVPKDGHLGCWQHEGDGLQQQARMLNCTPCIGRLSRRNLERKGVGEMGFPRTMQVQARGSKGSEKAPWESNKTDFPLTD